MRFGQGQQLAQRRDVAVHAEHPVGDDQPAPCFPVLGNANNAGFVCLGTLLIAQVDPVRDAAQIPDAVVAGHTIDMIDVTVWP